MTVPKCTRKPKDVVVQVPSTSTHRRNHDPGLTNLCSATSSAWIRILNCQYRLYNQEKAHTCEHLFIVYRLDLACTCENIAFAQLQLRCPSLRIARSYAAGYASGHTASPSTEYTRSFFLRPLPKARDLRPETILTGAPDSKADLMLQVNARASRWS